MLKSQKKIKRLLIILLIVFILIVLIKHQNNYIVISDYEYKNETIPKSFEDYRIIHISDLHNKLFGKNQSKILKKIELLNPDIIVITGDLVDRRKFNLENAMIFIKGAVSIAPIYYISGNHESWSGKYSIIKNNLIDAGVYILDNSSMDINQGEDRIKILGLQDPDFLTSKYIEGTNSEKIEEKLNEWKNLTEFKILLSHRPELFDLYVENYMDLIFTGHAHGGQFRIPFIGGVIAPDQGLFPKYTSGRYDNGLSTMFVSRGLGNSIVPVRLFNRPEIIVIKLKTTI